MLSIGVVKSGHYYTNRVSSGAEDYYVGVGEAPGKWLGRGAASMGLNGRVNETAFAAVLAGCHPGNGAQLVPERTRRTLGWDCTLSAPKSVSLMFGLADEAISRETVAAHDCAVEAAMGFLEQRADHVRRGRGGTERLTSRGWIAASFRHRTSRAGDPQIHSHVVVANLLEGTDGRWSGVDSRQVYSWARTAGFLYQAQLRAELTRRLGVRWHPVRNGVADIVGVPKAAIQSFSKRRQEIIECMNEKGTTTARGAQAATLDTRRSKQRDVDGATLRAQWWVEAADQLDLVPNDLRELIGPGRKPVQPRVPEVAARLVGPVGLTERRTTFSQREVLQAWAEAHPEGADVRQVERLADNFLAHPEVELRSLDVGPLLRRGDGRVLPVGGEARWTTTDLRQVEEAIVDSSLRRQDTGAGVASESAVEEALARRPSLEEEQRDMVTRITRGGAGVDVVRGLGGSGKTFSLECARDAWQQEGFHVSGAALAARAARHLEEASGISSGTFAKLLQDVRHDGLRPNSVVVIDEAHQIGSRDLLVLVTAAERANAKIVLVGDDGQLPSIDAGGGFRGLSERLGAAELIKNRRQVEAWERDALLQLRDGQVPEALHAYREHGRLVEKATAEEVREQLVRDWLQERRAGRDAVMVAATRIEIDDLNERARARLIESGELQGPGVEVGGREWVRGDELLTLQNSRSLQVLNGQKWCVEDVEEGQLVVIGGHGERRTLPDTYCREQVARGWASTAHKIEGLTTDATLVLASNSIYREWSYVALSRGRDLNRLYISTETESDACERGHSQESETSEVRLQRRMKRSSAHRLAIDSNDGHAIESPAKEANPAQTSGSATAIDRVRTRVAARTIEVGQRPPKEPRQRKVTQPVTVETGRSPERPSAGINP